MQALLIGTFWSSEWVSGTGGNTEGTGTMLWTCMRKSLQSDTFPAHPTHLEEKILSPAKVIREMWRKGKRTTVGGILLFITI
jgi:hypothetical protein